MRVVHVVALMAVVAFVTPVSAQAPRATTPDGAKAGGGRPLVNAVRAASHLPSRSADQPALVIAGRAATSACA